jgi:ABC-type antimicrobial peptide transport system permease subunit
MTLCVFIGFRFMTPYRETVERDNRPDYFLQLPFSASDRQLPEYLEQLESLGVCESIEVQRTMSDAVLSKNSVSSFLLEKAYGDDMKIITDSFGAPDFEGYPVDLYAVSSESELFEKFNSSATVGSLDKEAFEAGDEVLVFIPLYKDNGKNKNFSEGTGWEKVASSGIDLTFYEEYKHIYKKDGGISVGDKITVGAQTRYVGGIKYDYKIITDTAKVGAIIYYFPDEGIWPISGSDEGYQIVCSSKFAGHILPNSIRTRSHNEIRSFKIMYMSSGYGTTDFYINAKEGLSKYDVDTTLLVYARSEYMDIEFYHESNQKLLQDAINNILLVCLLGLTAVLLALLIFANTITSDIEQERNKIGILQSLGVSNKQLIKRQLYIGLAVSGATIILANVMLWLTVALYSAFTDVVLGNLLWGYPWLLHIFACIVLGAIITALYVLPMKSIQKYLPIENIKTRK